MDNNNFQRVGSVSNAHAGNDFEAAALAFFGTQGVALTKNFAVPVGVGETKKLHRFDLGSESPPVLVECKSHTWTQGGNMPSAKMTVWNEAMYYFHVAPASYRKIFFVLKHYRREQSLAAYYLKTHGHLVPAEVEIWEYDPESGTGERLR
ncbi:hypothetical protein [Bradyrhizobium sp. CCGUVB14]|uniref:hypothetical protein n=1 Tax=Bradyrhizobium sp. CCGUVB14 TaxID=2949628 RepID=UPI0020B32669|nr:hypothetical protein [Bradyrhizobium sp. CCGUVB14]MCP3447346.1 hypothetical protein [Bradyrhizobium sp. CCGUVB14]